MNGSSMCPRPRAESSGVSPLAHAPPFGCGHVGFFLVIVVSLFPLGVGPDPVVLRTIGPGVLWVAALLACLLSLYVCLWWDPRTEPLNRWSWFLSRWRCRREGPRRIGSPPPPVVLSPLLGLQFGLSGESLGVLVMSLSAWNANVRGWIGAIGAALVLGVRGSGAHGRPPGASTLRSSIDFWSWRRHQQQLPGNRR